MLSWSLFSNVKYHNSHMRGVVGHRHTHWWVRQSRYRSSSLVHSLCSCVPAAPPPACRWLIRTSTLFQGSWTASMSPFVAKINLLVCHGQIITYIKCISSHKSSVYNSYTKCSYALHLRDLFLPHLYPAPNAPPYIWGKNLRAHFPKQLPVALDLLHRFAHLQHYSITALQYYSIIVLHRDIDIKKKLRIALPSCANRSLI